MLKLLKGSQKLSVVIAKKNKGNLHNEVPHFLKLETPSYITQEDNLIFCVQFAQERGKPEFMRVKLLDIAS